MANTINIKKGLEAARSGITPAEAELIYTTDEKKLYIGDGTTAGGNLLEGGSDGLPDQAGFEGKFLQTDGTDATWETALGVEYITVTPVVSITTTLYELEYELGTISNYDSNTVYTITATNGMISEISDATFKYTAIELESDGTDTISVSAVGNGKVTSAVDVTNMIVLNIPIAPDVDGASIIDGDALPAQIIQESDQDTFVWYQVAATNVSGNIYVDTNYTETDIVSSTDPFSDGSLIAKYEMNGDSTDTCGNYDGTDTSMSYSSNGTDGRFGDCAVFDGSTSAIAYSNNGSLFSGTNEFTISLNMYPTAPFTTEASIFSQSIAGAASNSSIILYGATDSFSLHYSLGSGWETPISFGSTIPVSTWSNVVVTRVGTTIQLYIDGLLTNTGTLTGDIAVSTHDIELGVQDEDYYFDGKLDQVEIYNKALTPTEINDLYLQSINRFSEEVVSIISDTDPFEDRSLVAKYEFNNNVVDTCGNYDGTPTNITYDTAKFGSHAIQLGADGTSEVLTGINNNLLKDGSVSVFINRDISSPNDPIIGTITADSQYLLHLTDTTIIINNGTTSEYVFTSAFNALVAGYNHVVSTFGTTPVVYINSVAFTYDSTTEVSVVVNQDPLYIGRSYYAGQSRTSVNIVDQVEIYNKALTDQEVRYLYTQNKPKTITLETSILTDVNPFRDDSLVAKYLMNGNSTDETGNHDGVDTSMGYSSNGTDGKFGDCGVFNGSSSLTTLGVFNNSSNTYSLWFKLTGDTSSKNAQIIGTNADGNGWQFKIHYSNLMIRAGAANTTIVSADGDWHHVVILGDGSIYMDGILTVVVASLDHLDNNLVLGSNGSAGDEYYLDGLIDQVEVYNRALTPIEVHDLYLQTRSDKDLTEMTYESEDESVTTYAIEDSFDPTNGLEVTTDGTVDEVTVNLWTGG